MADLTGYKPVRWTFHSSIRETGFAVDRAVLEYIESAANLTALETIFDQATLADKVTIPVFHEGQEAVIFVGNAREWLLGGEQRDGRIPASLICEDERGKLLDTPVPPGMVCQGVSVNQSTGALTARETMLGMIKKLCALVGITVDTTGAPNYDLGPDFAPEPGMTIGDAIKRLLQGYQQVRRERLDFIRTGVNTYALKQRPTTLAGGIQVPRGAVRLRRYRKTYVPPLDDAEVRGFVAGVNEPAASFEARGARKCGTSDVFSEVIYPDQVQEISPITETIYWSSFDSAGTIQAEGTTTVTRLGNKTLSVVVTGNRFSAGAPTVFTKTTTYTYDGAGRLSKVVVERDKQGVLEGRMTKTLNYDDKGQVRVETLEVETLVNKVLTRTQQETIDKHPAGNGVLKDLDRWSVDELGAWTLEPSAIEFSPGTLAQAEETTPQFGRLNVGGLTNLSSWLATRFVYTDELIADQTALQSIADAAKNQGDKFLTEVDVEMPFDPRILTGSIIEFTGGSLVTLTSFYVTEVEITAQKTDTGELIRMRVMGEAWAAAPAGGAKAGSVRVRGGWPLLSELRGAGQESVKIMSGMVTAINGDGSLVVFVPEEGFVYPSVRSQPGLPPAQLRERVSILRKGVTLWRSG